MTSTAPAIDNLTLNIAHEIRVSASIEATFAALLYQLGPANETPEGKPLPMIIEPWPGGRWFRDLGDENGHLWGHIQAIKRPTLLEICGPLFFSFPVVSNVQYRLETAGEETLIRFRHCALGLMPDDYREGVKRGWTPLLERIRMQAEAGKAS